MSFKGEGPGTVNEIDRWAGGAGWIAHPEERMERASHAVVVDGEVWVLDPVDADGLDAFLADLGEVAGVVVLLDRHRRDCAAVASRHDVAVHVPGIMRDIAGDFAAETTTVSDRLPGTDYELRTVVDWTLVPSEPWRWREVALYDEESGTLIVPESLGTTPYMRTGGERVGVHPMRRLTPPRWVTSLSPERLLVGHGEGIHDDAADAVREAVAGSRRGAPRLYLGLLREALV